MLKLCGVTRIYNKGKKNAFMALDGVSLEFPDSGMVFVVGKSGCGKTTLLNIMGMLDAPDFGTVSIDGKSGFTDAEADAYRNRYVGFIFQDLNLLSDFDVLENIKLARKINREDLSQEDACALLSKLGIDGLESRDISQLSGGQKQRVSIARILTRNPRIILADEPTGSLDKKNARLILDVLKELSKDKLIVVVTHDLEAAERYADRIIRMANGKVVEDSVRNPYYERVVRYAPDRIEVFKNAEKTQRLIDLLNTRENRRIELGLETPFEAYTQRLSPAGAYKPSKKTRLPQKTLLKISFSKILRQKFKFLVSLFLIVISLSVFGVSCLFSGYNVGEVFADGFEQTGETGIVIQRAEEIPPFGYVDRYFGRKMYDKDREKLLSFEGIERLDAFYYLRWDYLRFNSTYSGSDFLLPNIVGYYETAEENLSDYGYSVLFGEYPESGVRDENGYYHVAITDYTAFIIHDIGASTPDGQSLHGIEAFDLIGKVVDFRGQSLYISAIIKTDFDYYKSYIKTDPSSVGEEIATAIFSRLYDGGYYASIFAARGMHEKFYAESMLDGSYQLFSSTRFDELEALSKNTARPVRVTYATGKNRVGDGEIIMSEALFLAVYGESFSPDKSYDRYKYNRFTRSEDDFIIGDFRVIGVFSAKDESRFLREYSIVLSESDFDYVANTEPLITGYHVRLPAAKADRIKLINFLVDNLYFHESQTADMTYEVYNNLSIYGNVFTYIGLILASVSALFIIDFMLSGIKDKENDIGILRAMGARGADISIMFLWQALFVFLIGAVLCAGIIAGLSLLLNNILYNSFVSMLHTELVRSIAMLTLNFKPFVYTFALMAGILLVSTVFPTVRLIKSKPIECIRRL